MELLNCALAGVLVVSENSKTQQKALKNEKTRRNEQHSPTSRFMSLILTFSEDSRWWRFLRIGQCTANENLGLRLADVAF